MACVAATGAPATSPPTAGRSGRMGRVRRPVAEVSL